jgi:hypothetical protein
MSKPLARASVRLRGRFGPGLVGRPRRAIQDGDSVVTAPEPSLNGHPLTDRAQASQASAQGLEAPWPRLLTLPRAANYLCLGLDVTRELARAGALRGARVTIPAPVTAKRKGGRVALVLLDRLELDRLVSAWRERP